MNNFRVKKIRKSALGQKLIDCREEKNLTLDDVYKICKIPIKYLNALEQEKWDDLPGEIYLKNFLHKYCNLLGLNFRLCFRQYKKQTQLKDKILHEKQKHTPSVSTSSKRVNLVQRKQKNKFNTLLEFITPKRFKIVLISIVLVIFLGYIYYKVDNYLSPPDLVIIYPEENFTTDKNIITISGKTEPEAMVFINKEKISVKENGDFDIDVKLKYGLNRFEIITQREHGRQQKEEVIIFKKQVE